MHVDREQREFAKHLSKHGNCMNEDATVMLPVNAMDDIELPVNILEAR